MLNLPARVKVFAALAPTDMRKSFHGLVGIVEKELGREVEGGDLFLFFNRKRDRLKVLGFTGDGLLILYKRLEPENARFLGFTEVGRRAHNRHVGVAESRRLVGVSRQSGPRRNVMSGQGSPTAPPRALRRAWFGSVNSGRS